MKPEFNVIIFVKVEVMSVLPTVLLISVWLFAENPQKLVINLVLVFLE
jgi:hypothetical protein